MKRRITLLAAIAIFITTVLSGCNGSTGSEVLKVMNWGDYIDDSLIPEFEEYYKEKTGKNISVTYVTVDNPQIMATKIETGKEDWDLACPSESIAERMLSNGSLLPIDVDAKDSYGNYIMENYRNYVSPYMKKAFADIEESASPDHSKTYTVGYMWGTFGILYNKGIIDKKVEENVIKAEDINSWSIMWNTNFRGSILMKNAVREIFPIALTYVYREQLMETLNTKGYTAYKALLDSLYDLNVNTKEKIALVEKELKYQRNVVNTLYETDDGKEGMINGDYALDQAWSGDAVYAIASAGDNVELDYIIPQEGSNIWYDTWVIPKYAKNTKAAQYWIDFLCKPENATRNMDFIGYTSTTASAEVIEWSFKKQLIDTACEEDEHLKELFINDYEETYESFYRDEEYSAWYEQWYTDHYEEWYNDENTEGLDLRYFYNQTGVTERQALTCKGRTYYTDKIMADAIQYPDEADINRCAVMKGFASNIVELNNMWVRVKGQELPLYVAIALICLVAIAAAVIVWRILDKNAQKKKLSKLLISRHQHNHEKTA